MEDMKTKPFVEIENNSIDDDNDNCISLKEFIEETREDEVIVEDKENDFFIIVTSSDFEQDSSPNKGKLLYFILDNLTVKKILSDRYVLVDMNEIADLYIADLLEREDFIDHLQDAIMNDNEEYCDEIIRYYLES